MYLSKEEISLLDSSIKYFEVGYRSYIAENIINLYDTVDKYRIAVIDKKGNYCGDSVILSGKINSVLNNLSQETQIKKIYTLLGETKRNCNAKITVNIKTEKKDAFLVVSEIISLTYIFGAELFSDMLQKFNSREEYMYLAEQYRNTRNNIAHPEASISSLNYLEVSRFISILTNFLDDKFFWYASKDELYKNLDSLTISINNSLRIINNLSMIPKQKNKFVCRTNEIKTIKTYLTGNEMGMGRMHYILISGFGGMGKTALISEVIMQLIKDNNNKLLKENRWFKFILFFTAKEEVLDVEDANNKINTFKLKSQISSLDDIKCEITKYLGTDDLLSYSQNGLIVIDNFETLPETEKQKINNFIIYESNQDIQYVITSRNNDYIGTNYQLQMKTFNETDGCEFIEKYLEENALLIELTELEKKKLITLCKGNTIVLVLSLNRLSRGVDLRIIEKELISIGSETINNIVSFMSKNSFDEIYKQFSNNENDIDRILQILVLYDDPIDKYSLKVLSETELVFVDQVVDALILGLILEQHREEVLINEFAKTYLLIKFKPNSIELIKKQNLIANYKRDLSMKKNKLLDCRERNPQIDNILKEWQPNNIIDELAILESFEAYIQFNVGRVDKRRERPRSNYNLKTINNYFSKIEETSTHPYIYAQKARLLLPLLKTRNDGKNEIRVCLEDSFEKTIISVETHYTNIKGTLSYASILRELGRFYLEGVLNPNFEKAANNSEKARDIYIKLNTKDLYYYFTLRNLAMSYMGIYSKNNEKIYLSEARKLWEEILTEKTINLNHLKTEASTKLEKCII